MNTSELYEYGESALAYAVPKAKAIVKNMICKEHHKKVSVQYDYTDEGTNAYITGYCCKEHAESVADALKEAELFDNVRIENK